MKCPKCGYTSFDYLRKCKKCDELLDDSRKALNLKMNEPTLFAGLKDDHLDAGEPIIDKAEEVVETAPDTSVSSPPEADFSPLVTGSMPDVPPSTTPDPIERRPQELSENISSEPSSELGALGDMDNLQPRQDDKGDLENLLKIELESGSEEGLELTPSFIDDSNRTEDIQNGEKNKEGEFVLFEDENKDDSPAAALGQMENDIPFEFSANDLDDDISLSLPSDTTDKDMIELELDMEDEESLDQILADLGGNGSSKK